MPFADNSTFTWPHPAAGQEINITWSFADFDSVDKALMGAGGSGYVSPSGAHLSFTGYPDFASTISDATMKGLVRQAFNTWDIHSGINFVEVADSVNADMRIGQYGTGNSLINQGESAFGHIDMWKGNDFHKVAIEINPNAMGSQDRFYNTVLHEIGHALGLDDTAGLFVSSSADAMNPTVLTTKLSNDDIAGIQSLYGHEPLPPDYITQVARLYEAGFNRSFDAQGLNFWIDQREAGVSLASMAIQFLDSREFTQRFGDEHSMSNATFVNVIYSNVLGRSADASGLAYWTGAMSGGMTKEQVLVQFSDSAENQAQSTYLSGLAQTLPGWWDLV